MLHYLSSSAVCRPADPQMSGACQAVTSEDFDKLVLDSFGKTTLAAATMGSVFDRLLDFAVTADAAWPSAQGLHYRSILTVGWAGVGRGDDMISFMLPHLVTPIQHPLIEQCRADVVMLMRVGGKTQGVSGLLCCLMRLSKPEPAQSSEVTSRVCCCR